MKLKDPKRRTSVNVENGIDIDRQHRDGSSSQLNTALMPLFISMALLGLCHGELVWSDSARRKKRILVSLNKVYCLVNVGLQWINAGRLFSVFDGSDSFGPLLMEKVMVLSFYIMCAINATICYLTCRPNRLPLLCTMWTEDAFNNGRCRVTHRRIVIGSVIICWLCIFGNLGYIVYIAYWTSLMDILTAPLTPSEPYVMELRAISIALVLFQAGSWTFTCALNFLIAFSLYFQFYKVSQELETAIEEDKTLSEHCLEHFRTQHQSKCKQLLLADKILSVYNASGIVFSILLILVALYMLMTYDVILGSPILIIVNLSWIGLSSAIVIVIAVGGGLLNHMVCIHGRAYQSIPPTKV